MTLTTTVDELERALAEAGGTTDADVIRRIDLLNALAWELSDSDVARAMAFAETAHALAEAIDALKSQGIEVVPIKSSELPPGGTDYPAFINYGFNEGVNQLFGAMEPPAPIRSLSDAVIVVDEDAPARAPYGQRYVQAAATTQITADEYEAAVAESRRRAEAWITGIVTTYNVDVVIAGLLYPNAGSAGTPTINIPVGLGVDPATGAPGGPTGVYITGPYLSDANVIAVGYALEQALKVDLKPDLEATGTQIDAVTGRKAVVSFFAFCKEFGDKYPDQLQLPSDIARPEVRAALQYSADNGLATDNARALQGQYAIWTLRRRRVHDRAGRGVNPEHGLPISQEPVRQGICRCGGRRCTPPV